MTPMNIGVIARRSRGNLVSIDVLSAKICGKKIRQMAIKIFNRQHKIKLDTKKICEYLPRIENELRLSKNGVCSIIFIDDREIKKLNKKYRKTNRPTDVLTFIPHHRSSVVGDDKAADIFISVETARNNAKIYKQKLCIEILRLIIHGILHSLDLTDYSKKAKEKMWLEQERVLKCILQQK